MQDQSHRFCVAPMMDWTDRHCRMFHRLLSRQARLYTEMITADAVLHGRREALIGFSREERPVALQLGGAVPAKLAAAARIGAEEGYDEINFNVGCPSDRVQGGHFGACMMAEPDLVADCVAEMRAAVPATIPVTVKCRIGIDDQDAEHDFQRFVETVAAAGCNVFVVHARKAWLQGLSPKENREIPPLDYGRVRRLKASRPDLTLVLNGGIADLAETRAHLAPSAEGPACDGVMLGRAAYQTPYLLAEVDRVVFGETTPAPTRAEVLDQLTPYIADHLSAGGRLHAVTRHILGLYHGMPGARGFRRVLSERAVRDGAGLDVLAEARAMVEGAAVARRVA
jgi:tRNA-dihydrouridine synthase A